MPSLSLTDVEEAATRIAPYVLRTPTLSYTLSRACTLHCKAESLQPVGAFKLRGAFNMLLSLPGDCPGVVAHSSGNHAQAIARAAKVLGIPATVVDDARKRVSDFKKHGADGFRAVCLLIETGNHEGIRCHPLLQATWEAGLERELLELCSRDSLPNYGLWSALQGLGYADAKRANSRMRWYWPSSTSRASGADQPIS